MARILHTSDWHVGKPLGRCDRSSDQRAALERIVEIAGDARPDLILHTGDVFDGPRPGHEQAQLAAQTLRELSGVAPTIVLAGNHDSQLQFVLFNTLLGDNDRLRFIDRGRLPEEGGIVDVPTSGGQRLRLAPLPFVHANRQVDWFGDPQRFMGVYADRLRKIVNLLHEGLLDGYNANNDVLVFAAHLFVGGAVKSGTERAVHVTEDYAIERSNLPGVSYVALGHIHKPQQLPGTPVARYAGSMVPMDFGEAGETKSVVIVDAEPGRPAHVETVVIDAGRRLLDLRGALSDLEQQAGDVGDAIVRVTVDCEDPIENLQALVRATLPHADIVEIIENASSRRLEVLDPADAQSDEDNLSYDELLDDYLATVGTKGSATAEQVRAMFVDMRNDPGAAERPPIAGLSELLDAELPPAPQSALQDASEAIGR